jgi:hypothetical protein
MGTGVTLLLLLVIIYFFKNSKSEYFLKSDSELSYDRDNVVNLLNIKGRNNKDIDLYLDAYDFFCVYKKKFDGATIVKDLCDLPHLDLDAVVHDYECLIGANRNYIEWFKSAWRYFENMRKNGKGNQIFRFVLLLIVGIIFVPYCYFFTKKYYPLSK